MHVQSKGSVPHVCYNSVFVFGYNFTIRAFSYQFVQGIAQAAVFIQDEEAPLPFLTTKHREQSHHIAAVSTEC